MTSDAAESGAWIETPRRSGRLQLTIEARLAEIAMNGFSVEASERIVLPRSYTVETDRLSPPIEAQALWCNFRAGEPGRKPGYQAGFDLPGVLTSKGEQLLGFMADLAPPSFRRFARLRIATRVRVKLRTESTFRLLAANTTTRPQLRIATDLLLSLRSRLRLELDRERGRWVEGEVIDVSPLPDEDDGTPRSRIEIAIADLSSADMQAWISG